MRSSVAWVAAIVVVALCTAVSVSVDAADCLSDIKSYEDAYELPAYGFRRVKAVGTVTTIADELSHIPGNQNQMNWWARKRYEIARNSFWPNELSVRSTCTDTAQWIYHELFRSYPAVNVLPLKANAPGSLKHPGTYNPVKTEVSYQNVGGTAFPVAVANWEQDTIWNANGIAFQNGEKRAVMIHILQEGGSSHDHWLVLEAPDHGELRVYQSFIECYSFKDWMRTPTTNSNAAFHTEEALFPLKKFSVCKPDSAHTAYGGGQLIKGSAATTLVSYIQDMIDAVHQNAGVQSQWNAKPNNRKTMREAYYAVTGVDLTAPATNNQAKKKEEFKIVLEYVQTSDTICEYNKNEFIDPVLTQFRNTLQNAVILTNTNHKLLPFSELNDMWFLPAGNMKALDTTIDDIDNLNQLGWNSQIYKTERLTYYNRVNAAADQFCTSGEYDYRYVVADQKTTKQQNIKTLTTSSSHKSVWLMPKQKLGGFKSVVALDLSCKTDAKTGDNLGMDCKMFEVKRLALNLFKSAPKKIEFRLYAEGGSRFEFQFCLNKNSGAVTKAQMIPFYTFK